MHNSVCLVLFLVGISGRIAAAKGGNGTYAVYFPKYIRPGTKTEFTVEILKSSNPISVTTTLKSKDWEGSYTGEVKQGEIQTHTIGYPIPYNYDGDTQFNVTSTGTDMVTGERFFTASTKKGVISYQKKFLSIFIQTDKAIYQPSQKIKFRAVVTTSELLPYEGKATHKITDPNGNVIVMESDQDLVNGVLGSEFQLGRYATLGDWMITYRVFGYEEKLTVTVQEYKLPKFKVEISTTQKFLHPGSVELSGEISAQFTFGQPVKGKGRIEMTIDKWRPRNQLPEKIILQNSEFDGTWSFSVEAKRIEEVLKWNPKWYSSPLKITAFVTDKNTRDEFNATQDVQLYNKRMKVETIATPPNIKPGLPYVAYIKISEQDGTLLSDNERENLNMTVEVTYSYPYPRVAPYVYPPSKTETIPVIANENGIATLQIVASSDNFESVSFNVKINSYPNKNEYWASFSASRFESPSNTYLQVSSKDSSLNVGDKAKITIHTTDNPAQGDEMEKYSVMILARGKLVKQEEFSPSTYDTLKSSFKFTYEFDVTSVMSPSLYIIVSFIRPDSEIVGDSMKITVQATLENEVVMTTSTNKTDAGMPVNITVYAAPDSFVGLRAIDQSVLLLKEGNDITREKIFQDLDKYGPVASFSGWNMGFRWWWPYPVGGADVKEVFDNSGVIALTDALLYQKPPQFIPWGRGCPNCFVPDAPFRQPMAVAAFAPSVPATGGAVNNPPKARTFFPESWIWDELSIGSDGSTTFSYNTPDTITTWELSSFAVSGTKGLGVTKQNSKITVFRKFFISLNLPPTMIRGEILNMRTTLFNYFDTPLDVTVTLKENEWYDLIIIGNDAAAAGSQRIITIPPQDSLTVVFPIKFMKVGSAKISVVAVSALAGDAVERSLVVKPEGIPKITSQSTIIDRPNGGDGISKTTFSINIPKDAVEGSSYAKVYASGNILGSSLSNLGNLLQMPSGCGEQTMLSFAPDVFISLYLEKVGELKGEIKRKSKSHIQEGYQNELRYQRSDGSFSAFGKNDRSGSTWLTAFVVKSFIAAIQLNPDLVEEKIVNKAVNFLIKQQQEDGIFGEPGRVIHQDMQGGVENKETMTAYVLIALAEGNYFSKNKEVEDAMFKAQKMLEDKIPLIRDTYTLSIVAYALSLVSSEKLTDVMGIIDSRKVVSGNLQYWAKKDPSVSRCSSKGAECPFDEDQASSSSIEITSYMLLTYAKMERSNEVMPIVRWLVEQRGAFGGYRSTQDTVMGIQALATVAGLFADRDTDLTLTVTHDGKDGYSEQFIVTKENAIILQMAELPNMSGVVTVSASGVGVADVQVTAAYNLPIGPRNDEPFDVDIKVQNKQNGEVVNLEVCSKINEDRENPVNGTGMFVVSFTLPSGYTIDDKEATRANRRKLKLVELVDQEVAGYFDELPKGPKICMTLKLRRYAQVSGVKPQLLKAFDYYNQQRSSYRQFEPEKVGVCDICGDDCVGCPPLPTPPPEPECKTIPDRLCGLMSPVPCPDFMDGLYYDSKSHITYMRKKYPDDPECPASCTAPNGGDDSSNYPGLPGTYLNGVNQYVMCSQPIFRESLLSRDGFTISLLVYPTQQDQPKRYTVFSIGGKNVKKPYILMEKRPRVNQYWVKLRLNGYEVTVRTLFLNEIRIRDWTHVVITYDGAAKMKVYLNGVSEGNSRNWKTTTDQISDDVTMKLGRSHVGNAKSRGNFQGLVSNLDVWLTQLSSANVKSVYNQYSKLMLNVNPMLPVPLVHRVVPSKLWKCFRIQYSAADLKEREGSLRNSCEEPVKRTPPHLPLPVA